MADNSPSASAVPSFAVSGWTPDPYVRTWWWTPSPLVTTRVRYWDDWLSYLTCTMVSVGTARLP
ncbi:hypothetical protein [Streptomyces sp. NPDC018584]|uniref:hypothetical protein n=1 Tax=unclassified Streptomyces TaxID=2593676 RepID=UPI0037B2F4AA